VIDDIARGPAPLTITLPAGIHRLAATHPGYDGIPETFVVRPRARWLDRVTLEPLDPAPRDAGLAAPPDARPATPPRRVVASPPSSAGSDGSDAAPPGSGHARKPNPFSDTGAP